MLRFPAAATLGVLLSTSAAFTAQIWETPYTSWTSAEARKVLDDSPWSGKAKLSRVGSGRGRFMPPRGLTVRVAWSSASVMRQAVAQARSPQLEPASTLDVNSAPAEYVVTAFVANDSGVFHYSEQAELYRRTTRLVAGGISLSASSVTSVVRDRAGQIVSHRPNTNGCNKPMPKPSGWTTDPQFWAGAPIPHPANEDAIGLGEPYAPMGPPGDAPPSCNLTAVLTFTFPKSSPLNPADGRVEFGYEEGRLLVQKTFDLRRMTVGGTPSH